ncbi:phage tail assembly chaperone [Devosia riboflavina]
MDDPPDQWPPDLLPGADELLKAFWELCSDRPVGVSAAAIPFTAIDRWAARNGFDDPDDFASLTAAIRAMDGEWVRAASGASAQPQGRALSPELFDAMWG